MTQIADILPGISLLVAICMCVYTKDSRAWGRLCHLQGFILILNGIAELSTTMPSSYGYKRCLKYLDIKGPDDLHFSINPMGSCAAMIWSGHTFHFMLGIFVCMWVCEEHFHYVSLSKSAFGCKYSPQRRDVILILSVIIPA